MLGALDTEVDCNLREVVWEGPWSKPLHCQSAISHLISRHKSDREKAVLLGAGGALVCAYGGKWRQGL